MCANFRRQVLTAANEVNNVISHEVRTHSRVGHAGALHRRRRLDFHSRAAADQRSKRAASIFESVLQHIQNDYVDEPNMEKVRAGALRGLAYGLDPYSTYLTPEQVREFSRERKEQSDGNRRRAFASGFVSLRDCADEGFAG